MVYVGSVGFPEGFSQCCHHALRMAFLHLFVACLHSVFVSALLLVDRDERLMTANSCFSLVNSGIHHRLNLVDGLDH